MDWQLAITRNREALLTTVIALMNSLGLVKGGALTTLPFHLCRKALLIIRPAEAALRRLIIIAAHDLIWNGFKYSRRYKLNHGDLSAVHFTAARLSVEGGLSISPLAGEMSQSDRGGCSATSFRLIEPLKSFTAELPDFASFDQSGGDLTKHVRIPASTLGRRLLALHNALNSIDKQAKRLARWYAARDEALKRNAPHRLSPMRPGLPPGYRRRSTQEVETILNECHGLAHCTLERRDSS